MRVSIVTDHLTLVALARLLNELSDSTVAALPLTSQDRDRLLNLQQQIGFFAGVREPPAKSYLVDVCENSTLTEAERTELLDDAAEGLEALNQATGFAPFDDGGPTAHDLGRVCRWCGEGENLNPTGTWCHMCERSNVQPDEYRPRKGR